MRQCEKFYWIRTINKLVMLKGHFAEVYYKAIDFRSEDYFRRYFNHAVKSS